MDWRLPLPNLRYGTEGYPEKVARRLRAVNITAWSAAAAIGILALLRLTDPERWRFGLVTLSIAAGVAAIPLLHRFGPLVAPLALVAVVYIHLIRVVANAGTNDGASMSFLTAAGLVVLVFGIEYAWVAAALAALAAGLLISLHVIVPYDTGLLPTRVPFIGSFGVNVVINTAILFAVVLYAVRQTARAEAALEREHQRSEGLIRNILPPAIAARLKDAGAEVIADRYDNASILFADMAGFTARSADTEPEALVRFLDDVFGSIDRLVERHGLEKIKTTGDAYMVVSGLPDPRHDHAAALADFALDLRDSLVGLVDPKGRAVPVRIGIASGPVVAGVVGRRKFFYDVWGDAVNTAARMEQTADPGTIQVAPLARDLLEPDFTLEDCGVRDVRGKGPMQTWILIRRKDANEAERLGPTAQASRHTDSDAERRPGVAGATTA